MQGHIARGWSGWQAMVARGRVQLAKIEYALRHLKAQSEARALRPWREASSWRPLARRALAFLSRRGEARALVSWRSVWAARVRSEQLVRSALMRLMHSHIARGWSGWQVMVARRRAQL